MRAADERWTLKRGQTYWVRIGKIRKRDKSDERRTRSGAEGGAQVGDKPALINARTAPIRVM
jgi:hypothetical protein